jgi:ketosteroid isomerase-like protein
VRTEDDVALAQTEVRNALATLNSAWLNRRYDELAQVMDEDVVMALPGFVGQVRGRAAMVEGFREFMERSTILRFEEASPTIDVWGDTAVAVIRWEMDWTTKGGPTERAAGHDAFVFNRGEKGWRAVWRTMSVESEQKDAS